MTEFEPRWQSLDTHQVPEWYEDAKLGIFVHWGVYSVPAWAPPDADIAGEKASPYAEWYPYYMYEEGSPTKEYHEEYYGDGFEYADFIGMWEAEEWDPEAWAELFADVGARYVVLTGEHHDGFPLWDSHYATYNAAEMGPERDIVGELETAVRDRGLRFAASYHANYNYYQPGFEGRFGHPNYTGGGPFDETAGPGSEYVDFMNVKHRELIRKYEPDLLWFDVPKAGSDHLHAKELIADYYNWAAEQDRAVAVNDRASTDAIGGPLDADSLDREASDTHGDFVTPEYTSFDEQRDGKWEATRGIGRSFGYNVAERPEDRLSVRELVHSFVDIVSKNGNLLINVGPRADGTIPDPQREVLAGLGRWLDVHGGAIFGSRPWTVAEDPTASVDVCYTYRDGDLYATALDWPDGTLDLAVPGHVPLPSAPAGTLLTAGGGLDCGTDLAGNRLTVELPARPDHDHAFTVRLDGVSNPRTD